MEMGQSRGICTREISVCCFRAAAHCSESAWLGQGCGMQGPQHSLSTLSSAGSPAQPLPSAVGSPGIPFAARHCTGKGLIVFNL